MIWKSNHKLYAFSYIFATDLEFYVLNNPYRCKLQEPDAFKRNAMTSSEMEIEKHTTESKYNWQ